MIEVIKAYAAGNHRLEKSGPIIKASFFRFLQQNGIKFNV
jgi:hypothetical protein